MTQIEEKCRVFSNVGLKTSFLGDFRGLIFSTFFGKKSFKKFIKFFENFRKEPKNRLLLHSWATFFPKFRRLFSKTAYSAPFSGALQPKIAGLLRGSKAP